jgi:hypothetical protein
MRTVDQAFQAFAASVANAGLSITTELLSNEASRIARLVRNGGELRLVWIPRKQYLSLEVDHGPSKGVCAGWLELFGVTCVEEAVPDESELPLGFESSLSYGLELMGLPDQEMPPNQSLERTREE